MNFEELISSCLQKNAQSQRELYDYLAPKLFGACLKYAQNQDDAKDYFQESFILIFKKLHQFNFKSDLFFWAKKITINHCISQLKKNKNLAFTDLETIETHEEINEEEEFSIDQLLKLVQELPTQYKMVFNLYILDHYSHREIAEMLNISEGTSKSNLSRAKMILKQKITSQQKNTLYYHEK